MGGGRSPLCVAYNLTVRPVTAPTGCCFPRIALLVVTSLAFQHEVVRVQRDVRVVAVDVVQPCPPVVHDPARLYTAGLAQPSVDGRPFFDVCVPGASPRLGLVELLLVNVSRPPSAPASPMPVIYSFTITILKIKNAHERSSCKAQKKPPFLAGGTKGTKGTHFSYIAPI